MDEWKDQEKYVFFVLFSKLLFFFILFFFNLRFEDCRRFNTSIMCLTFFVIVLNIMVVAFGGPGLDIKPWYQKNGQKSSRKAKKTITWYSFRKRLTFFIIVLNIMVIAFGGPAPGLHYTSNFDTISEITFLNYFFIYKIGCTTDIIILRYWIISFSSF